MEMIDKLYHQIKNVNAGLKKNLILSDEFYNDLDESLFIELWNEINIEFESIENEIEDELNNEIIIELTEIYNDTKKVHLR